ncbi:hypothetical protein ABZ419_25740 [Streptomyces cinnamoneus]|uniref:hypothetical protein n=1 Tax=Streptomyces cinnamoneus TaxID=53446 RepID=UPI0033DFBACF
MAVTADRPADDLSAITAAAAGEARNQVLRIAMSNLPAEVRASAWNALRSSRGDEAIAEWLAPGGGYDYIRKWVKEARVRNREFCARVLRTHAVEFSPEVHAAADRALKGTDADRAAFVKAGYAEAQQRDRVSRDADAQRRREVSEKERDLVRSLAERDPGEQVRVAAQWALRPGAVDADIAEFYGYGWATGGTLDVESYRMRIADAETLRHHTLSLLIKQAVAAEEAVKGAADAAKAKAEAEQAWRAVAEHADVARKTWLAEQATAAAQADNWRNIAKASKESADQLWKNVSEVAETNQGTWAREQAEAAGTAAFWKDMFDRAQAGESRVKG